MRNRKGFGALLSLILAAAVLWAMSAPASVRAESSDAFYTVDFAYEGREYSMSGGESILLSELFAKLEIVRDTADVTSVTFSNASLLAVARKEADWRLISRQPFDTHETLTVTFRNGEVMVIQVEDAIASGTMDNGISWELTDENVLRIYPTDQDNATALAQFNRSREDKSGWPWNRWRESIHKVVFEKNPKGAMVSFAVLTNQQGVPYYPAANFMFADCVNLTKVDVSGLDTANAGGLARMFSGCTALTEIDLSTLTNDAHINNMQNMFNGCTKLKKVVFNNPSFESRVGNTSTGGLINGINGMFQGCGSLEYVDMSNLTLHFRTNDTSMKAAFKGKSELQTVLMKNACFDGVRDLNSMLANCPKLTWVEMSGDRSIFPDAVSMSNMFKGSFTTDPQEGAKAMLDVSGFGELEHIVNMDGFVSGCTKLDVLNIKNLNNLRIEPRRNMHSASLVDPGAADLNIDWGRELGVETCTGLDWILAEGSKVWMVKNTKGSAAGGTYFDAQKDSEIYYFTRNQMDFYRSGTENKVVTIATKRDYIDMMTDREKADPGNKNATYNINQQRTPLPDGVIDTYGAGILPAGNFRFGGPWTRQEMPSQPTYYRIDETLMANSTPSVSVLFTDQSVQGGPSLIDKGGTIVTGWHNADDWLNDYNNTAAYAENADGSPVIRLVYPAAAMDVNGKVHDVIVNITKITFTNIDRIPESIRNDTTGVHAHETNYYVNSFSGGGGKYPGYYRPVVRYDKGKLQLMNYVWGVPGADTANYIKGDSGTEIEFSIQIKDALPDTSVLFFMDDLDIPASQQWEHGHNDEGKDCWCYDYLRFDQVSYDDYSEGIVLGDGNDMTTVKVAPHTGIEQVGSYLHATGPDPSSKSDTTEGSTYWSGFSVKANADEAHYTWTSGVGCTTELLQVTPENTLPDVAINPQALKTVNGDTPVGDYENAFDFQLVAADEFGTDCVTYEYFYVDDGNSNSNQKESVGSVLLDNLAGKTGYDVNTPLAKQNSGESVDFGRLTFPHPKSTTYDSNNGNRGTVATNRPNGPLYQQYDKFPDASYRSTLLQDSGDRGYNEHIANAYIYKIQETNGTNTDVLEYNTSRVVYFLKVVVSDPKNDREMARGVKAEVTVGRYYYPTREDMADPIRPDDIAWDDYTQVIWSNDSTTQGRRQQTPREVSWTNSNITPSTSGKARVLIDRDGVHYLAVPGRDYYGDPSRSETVYLNANDPSEILVPTRVGRVYPYDVQDPLKQVELGHKDKALRIPLTVEGAPVYVDVHGTTYVKTAEGYCAVTVSGSVGTRGDALTVKDGVFNPDGASDRQIYVDKTVTVGGNTYSIYVDALGQSYYTDGTTYTDPSTSETRTQYFDENGNRIPDGKLGDVTPDENDAYDTRDANDPAILHIHGHKVRTTVPVSSDELVINYYQAERQYYTVTDTILTPGQNGFSPRNTDPYLKVDFDIFEDSDGTLYYQDGGRYYKYDPEGGIIEQDSYTPTSTETTDRKIVNLGLFNNRVKTSDITVKKEIDGSGSGKSDLFQYTITFNNGFDLSDYAFLDGRGSGSLSDREPLGADGDRGGTVTKVSDGVYTVTLREGQSFVAYKVPFQTTYTIEEGLDLQKNNNGWEFVSATAWDEGQSKQIPGNSRMVAGTIGVERVFQTTDTTHNAGDPNPAYNGQYDHVYKNRFTELILNKVVTKGDKTEKFAFKAEVKVSAEQAKKGFSYGWMDENDKQVFKTFQKETATGEETVTIDNIPALSHGKDVVLVVPYGAKVRITETNEGYNASWKFFDKDGVQRGEGNNNSGEFQYTQRNRVTFYNYGAKDLTVIKQTGPKDPSTGKYPTGTFTYTFQVDKPADYTESGLTPLTYSASTTPDEPLKTTGTVTATATGYELDVTGGKITFEKSGETWIVTTAPTTLFDGEVRSTVMEETMARVLLTNGTVLNIPRPTESGGTYSIAADQAIQECFIKEWKFEIAVTDETTGQNNPTGDPKHFVIKEIPFGTTYMVTEMTPDGWRLKSSENTTGTVKNDTDKLGDAKFENEVFLSLTVGKTVTGNMGSKDKYFKVEITIQKAGADAVLTMSGADQNPVKTASTAYETNMMKTANTKDDDDNTAGQQIICDGVGSASINVYLRHGQSVAILGLPKGAQYTATEIAEGYTPSVTVTGDDKTDDGTAGGTDIDTSIKTTVTDTHLSKAATVTFTNELETPVPTGIVVSAAPAMAGAGLGAMLLAIAAIFRKRKAHR